MKQLLLLWMLLAAAWGAHAQDGYLPANFLTDSIPYQAYDSVEVAPETMLDSVFGLLNPAHVPTGLLMDRSIAPADPTRYAGDSTADDTCAYGPLLGLYASLHLAAMGSMLL